jgi:beta-phosphoglucomutase-like phosphatase (HAD superfamily)
VLRAIVFDFDGVIANSEPLHFRAYRDVLLEEDVTLAESDYYGRYLGYDDVGAFGAMAADRGLDWNQARIADLVRRKAVRLEELERDVSVLFPGSESAIRTAATAVPIAIASGALGAEIRRVLDRAGLTKHFAAIVAAEDTPVSKPAPDPYLRALELLSRSCGPLAPGECIALEDSRWGLQSAKAAGLRTVGVAHTYGPESLAPADLIIPSMQAFNLDELRRLTEN